MVKKQKLIISLSLISTLLLIMIVSSGCTDYATISTTVTKLMQMMIIDSALIIQKPGIMKRLKTVFYLMIPKTDQ